MRTQSAGSGRELRTATLGALPVVNHPLARLGLDEILARHLPDDDARYTLAPATVVGLLVRNLVLHREPVYALREWAAGYDPALFGLTNAQMALVNDDRVGRVLDKLFDADPPELHARHLTPHCSPANIEAGPARLADRPLHQVQGLDPGRPTYAW